MYFIHVYMYIFFQKKKFKIFKSFPKKGKKFSKKKKKGLWTRGIEPLSHFKKKNFFELGALDFLVIFFKKDPFFSFKDFKIL